MRVAFQMCESHFIVNRPFPPKSPLQDKSLGGTANINIYRRFDLMMLLILAQLADVNINIDSKYLYAGSCIIIITNAKLVRSNKYILDQTKYLRLMCRHWFLSWTVQIVGPVTLSIPIKIKE